MQLMLNHQEEDFSSDASDEESSVVYFKPYLYDKLWNAIDEVNETKIEELLKAGAATEFFRGCGTGEENKKYENRMTPLELAFHEFELDIAKLLLLHGAKLLFVESFHKEPPYLTFRCIPHFIADQALCELDNGFLSEDMAPKAFIEAIRLYQAFGGNLYVKDMPGIERDKEEPENVMEFLVDYIPIFDSWEGTNIGEKFLLDVLPELKEIMGKPLSLKALSRIKVRNCMSRNYLNEIDTLDIPDTLKGFLRFEDTLPPLDQDADDQPD